MKTVFFIFILFVTVSCSNKAAEKAKKLNDNGVSFLDKEEYEKAASSFHAALSQGDLGADLETGILRNLSLMFSFQNQKDSARIYAKRALERADDGSYYHFLTKAEFALIEEDVQAAKVNFEKAKTIQPEEMAIYNSLGMIYSGKYGVKYQDFNKALDNNKKAYEISKREPLADALATSYMNLELYKESIPLWESLIKENPAKMEYHFQLGVALLFSGKEIEGEEKMEYAAARDENCKRMLAEMIAE
jgi:tetratricopeptide (TPR) repeat protein